VRELTQVEFIRNAGCRGSGGALLLGTTQGMVVFNPRDLAGNPVPPAVVLTDLKLFNRSVPVRPEGGSGALLTRSITATQELTLSHRDSAFSLEFAALHFVDPERNEYAYMLEGLDRTWNTLGTTRSVSYTTLPPGNYVFRLRASNCDGLWNMEGLTLRIRVLPPWWQTWWMRSIEGLVLLQAVLLALGWRMRRLRRRNQDLEMRVQQRTEALEAANLKLQELDKLKENMAAMLVHDLRSPLTTIGFTLDLLEDSGNQDEPLLNRCRHSIHSMVAMLNDLLEVFRTQGGAMPLDLSPVFPVALSWSVRSAFHLQCETKQVRLEIDVPEELPALEADEQKAERALSNLVANALKYTPAGGVITLRAREVWRSAGKDGGNGIVFEVQDTGAGIPAEDLPVIFDPYRQATRRDSNLGVGLGLAIVQRIMAAHGGTVSVASEVGRGSTFTLFFPL
jgi:signal transduction histidine kinase